MQEQILLVEDDAVLNRTLAYNLRAQGYVVRTAQCAAEAQRLFAEERFAMALLDVNLPDGDGFALCRNLRATQPQTLVLFLTANDDEAAQIQGYALGAVDYITKPFSIEALRYKIRALFALAAYSAQARDIYDDGQLLIDFAAQRASCGEIPLSFTAMEFRVLKLFCRNPQQVLTRRQILEALWDSDGRFVEEHTLTATVSRIRGKLEAAGATGAIRTVYGMGYQWMGGAGGCGREDR